MGTTEQHTPAADGKQVKQEMSLDAQADAFLRNRGYGDLARKH